MPLVPHRFLFRMTHPCLYYQQMPNDDVVDLPESHCIDNFAGLDGAENFATVRMAWNELGIGFQVEVVGKDGAPQGSTSRARSSDGVTLWMDTRDARGSHRGSRYCHQFHFLPTGGGPNQDEPSFSQAKINRALQDAPLCKPSSVPFRLDLSKSGYKLAAFLSASVLNGYDPEQHPRLGFFYAIRDLELGEQVLSVGSEFPYWEDPSLWSTLDLVRS